MWHMDCLGPLHPTALCCPGEVELELHPCSSSHCLPGSGRGPRACRARGPQVPAGNPAAARKTAPAQSCKGRCLRQLGELELQWGSSEMASRPESLHKAPHHPSHPPPPTCQSPLCSAASSSCVTVRVEGSGDWPTAGPAAACGAAAGAAAGAAPPAPAESASLGTPSAALPPPAAAASCASCCCGCCCCACGCRAGTRLLTRRPLGCVPRGEVGSDCQEPGTGASPS